MGQFGLPPLLPPDLRGAAAGACRTEQSRSSCRPKRAMPCTSSGHVLERFGSTVGQQESSLRSNLAEPPAIGLISDNSELATGIDYPAVVYLLLGLFRRAIAVVTNASRKSAVCCKDESKFYSSVTNIRS